ncbi:unnamed protein product [Tilletia controversa]|uniref:Transmembrane protein n=3 Tax=Tilletia TaxID=13289 RepID=A0A8X7SUW5_9BASI|nr:hypothetical protein CF336_g8423 [Tilletia laevis]KAE8184168.1 hypothetical protein CF328_g7945 [Tilletia controversa]KAE8243156.1 hypothetical protein A4X03_0g7853 [Tilletia caries]KAE8184461.1 hypothetical protein CF335_g8015 [Tilletia laevis]KAE8243740.1 hypothetical protein A4X06_0g6126 [Tilletia controversa]
MVDWYNPIVVLQGFEATVILGWITIGFVVREQINTARFDWEIITGKRERRWPQAIYFFVKFIWWIYISVTLLLVYTFNEIDCNRAFWVIEAFMGLITLCCSVLLACRTVCVYQRTARKVVTIFLAIFSLGLAAAWAQGVTSVTTEWIPGAGKPWTTGMCVWTAVRMDYSAKYIVTIIFDLTVLMMTVYGVARIEGSATKIGQTLVRQGIVYFIVTCAANALITAFTIAQLNPVMSLFLAVPVAGVTTVASTRLYVELAERARPLQPRTYTRETEEHYFGTSTGTLSDTRKRNFMGMFRKTSSGSGSSLEKIPATVAPSSPFADGQTPATSYTSDGQLLLVQQFPRQPVSHDRSQLLAVEEEAIEHPGTPGPAADSIAAEYAAGWSQSFIKESVCPVGCVTPSGNCVHRPFRSSRQSLSVLPSAAAAAANLTIRESRTVTTEPMPVYLQHPPTSSPQAEEAVAREYPMLSGRRESDERSL